MSGLESDRPSSFIKKMIMLSMLNEKREIARLNRDFLPGYEFCKCYEMCEKIIPDGNCCWSICERLSLSKNIFPVVQNKNALDIFP